MENNDKNLITPQIQDEEMPKFRTAQPFNAQAAAAPVKKSAAAKIVDTLKRRSEIVIIAAAVIIVAIIAAVIIGIAGKNDSSESSGFGFGNVFEAAFKSKSVWDGSVDTEWYTGDKDSYDIKNAAQLAGLAKLVNSGESMKGITFNLRTDIALNENPWRKAEFNANAEEYNKSTEELNKDIIEWIPIGTYELPFEGNFYGNGHVISNMYVVASSSTNDDYGKAAGFFGASSESEIKQLKIDSAFVTLRSQGRGSIVGGLVGLLWHDSVISECSVTNSNIRASASVSDYSDSFVKNGLLISGGLVGEGYGSTITDCEVAETVSDTFDFNNAYLCYSGGIVASDNSVDIANCVVKAWQGDKSGSNVFAISNGMKTTNCFYSAAGVMGSLNDMNEYYKEYYPERVPVYLTEEKLNGNEIINSLGELWKKGEGGYPTLKIIAN